MRLLCRILTQIHRTQTTAFANIHAVRYAVPRNDLLRPRTITRLLPLRRLNRIQNIGAPLRRQRRLRQLHPNSAAFKARINIRRIVYILNALRMRIGINLRPRHRQPRAQPRDTMPLHACRHSGLSTHPCAALSLQQIRFDLIILMMRQHDLPHTVLPRQIGQRTITPLPRPLLHTLRRRLCTRIQTPRVKRHTEPRCCLAHPRQPVISGSLQIMVNVKCPQRLLDLARPRCEYVQQTH